MVYVIQFEFNVNYCIRNTILREDSLSQPMLLNMFYDISIAIEAIILIIVIQ